MGFKSEKEMVEAIIESNYIKDLTNPGPSIIKEEVKGLFGVPDIIVVKKNSEKQISYAFEAKLTNWRRALVQAFRYKAFVNRSYVIMDHDHVAPALLQGERFSRSNIGLMSIDNTGTIYFHYHPYDESPYSPQLESKFNSMVTETMPCR